MRQRNGCVRGALIAFGILILGMNRELVGKEVSWLLDSYRVHTWCLLALLAVTVGCRLRSGRAAAVAVERSESFASPEALRAA